MESATPNTRSEGLKNPFGSHAPQQGRNVTLLIGTVLTAALVGVAAASYLGKLDIPTIQGFQVTPEMVAVGAAITMVGTGTVAYAFHRKNQKKPEKPMDPTAEEFDPTKFSTPPVLPTGVDS